MTDERVRLTQGQEAAGAAISGRHIPQAGKGPEQTVRARGRWGAAGPTRGSARARCALGAALLVALVIVPATGLPQDSELEAASGRGLTPTAHPPLPRTLADFWFVPAASASQSSATLQPLADAVRHQAAGDYARVLARLGPRLQAGTALADHALYQAALANRGLNKLEEARALLAKLRAREPAGYLSQAAPLAEAELALALNDAPAAFRLLDELSRQKTASPDYVLLLLGKSAAAVGDQERAARTWLTVYYSHALGPHAAEAATLLGEAGRLPRLAASRELLQLELGRAEQLFGARRYTDAQKAFEALKPLVSGEDGDLVSLRLAECDFYRGQYRTAMTTLRPHADKGARQAEALFHYLLTMRQLGNSEEYIRLVRRLVEEFPTSTWAEDALNNLGSHHIIADEDEQADEVFRQILTSYPGGRHAERAAWKAGWWAYKHGRYQETIRIFEAAASSFPRSDYRPSFLYWTARAYQAVGDKTAAAARYSLVVTDYGSSYYGRLAARRGGDSRSITARTAEQQEEAAQAVAEPADVPNGLLISELIRIELWDLALEELRFASRVWGISPRLVATEAWLENKRGDLRRGINLMKRAYPQYLTQEASRLPREIREVLFPLAYWNEIKQYAGARRLDPYLVAALVAQESTFTPDARSVANAIGLMQLLPSTGRQYARKLGIRRFSTSMLTRPAVNLRLGVAYFGDLVKRFGGVHLALASYNAGESRIVKWRAERPGIDTDEFIDDIPFPETQNYVKRILGTAEDYRALYAPAKAKPAVTKTGKGE